MPLLQTLHRSACALLLLAAPVAAQQGVQTQGVAKTTTSSPIDDLIRQSENAFNDLQYLRADSFATQVLALNRISSAQRMQALRIRAASYFPEEASAQKRALALATLKEIVHSDIDAKLPASLTWPGLDSLLAEAKRTTFGAAITADSEQTAIGPSGTAEIHVRANRLASFRLFVAPVLSDTRVASGSVDSVSSGVVRFPTMRDSKPLFSTGDYEVTVVANDLTGTDSSIVRTIVHVTAPELKYDPVPMIIDSSRFVKERTSQYGWRGVLVAAVTSGGIYGLSSMLRADPAIKDGIPADSRGVAVAGAVGVGVLAASFLDPGRIKPSALVANQRVRDDFAKSIRDVQATNASRLANYRVSIAIQQGVR